MRKFLNVLILSTLTIFILHNCKLEEDCYQQGEGPMVNYTFSDSIAVDSALEINIEYYIFNNCGKLVNVSGELDRDTLKLHVISEYTDCDCPGRIPDTTTTYTFTPDRIKTYYIKAWVVDKTNFADSIATKTLKVYNPGL